MVCHRVWLNNPILERQLLPHWSQGNTAAVSGGGLCWWCHSSSFLVHRCSLVTCMRSSSRRWWTSRTVHLQLPRSAANSPNVESRFEQLLVRTCLCLCCACVVHQLNVCQSPVLQRTELWVCSRQAFMLRPIHRRRAWSKKASMPVVLHFSKTSVFGVLLCHCMSAMRRKQRRWTLSNCCMCRRWSVHVSEPYNNTVSIAAQ